MTSKNPIKRFSVCARPSSMKVKKRMFAVVLRNKKGKQYLPLLPASFDRIVRAMEPHKDRRTYFMSVGSWRNPPALWVSWKLHD